MELDEILRSIRESRSIPSEEDLRSLPNKKAFIYGRVSTQGQVRDSRESIHEVAKLIVLAKKDGYQSDIDPDTVEGWLDSIQNGEDVSRTMEEGDIAIDCRDLGLSGSLGADKRPGLKALWQRVGAGEMGAVYLTEGMSRLSRDRDRVLGYKLLRLLKEQKCRIRTPEGVYNPAVSRDWDYLADDIEDSAEEMKKMGVRLGRRRVSKAAQGRHVGSPVCPGYIVEIEGQRNNGSYILGKWQPYTPHQEVVITVLKELVKHRSVFRAVQSLNAQRVVFPFFPEKLKYMETRSALRLYRRNDRGYIITTNCLKCLATNLKLIGIWEWKDILIEDNHPAVVPVDIFLQAYEIAVSNKPRGRAAYKEPMEWAGLIYCYNHEQPRRIAAHSVRSRWACDHDKHLGIGPSCLYIENHLLTPPLTSEFLRCLDPTDQAQKVLEKLKSEASDYNLEESRWRRQDTELRTRLANLENCLGTGDTEREETYWRLVQEVKEQIKLLGNKPPPIKATPMDIEKVTGFLEHLDSSWEKYPNRLRRRLLILLIDRVELRHDPGRIEATIVWKAGFRQVINIKRPSSPFTKEKHWQPEEDNLIRMLWASASWEAILAALPGRTQTAISLRAWRMKLKRQNGSNYRCIGRPWTEEDDNQLKEMYANEVSLFEISTRLKRTEAAVKGRVSNLAIKRPIDISHLRGEPIWESGDFKVIDGLSTQKHARL